MTETRSGLEASAICLYVFSLFLDGIEERTEAENIELFRLAAVDLGVKLGDFLMPARVAITGKAVSLPLLESIHILGIDESRKRLQAAQKMLAIRLTKGAKDNDRKA